MYGVLQEKNKNTETNSPYEMVIGNWDTRFLSANITFSGLIYLLYLYSLSFCCLLPSFRYCFNVVVVAFCLSGMHCVIRQRYTEMRVQRTFHMLLLGSIIKLKVEFYWSDLMYRLWDDQPYSGWIIIHIQYPLISIQALSSAVSVDVIFHIKLT